MVIYTHVATRRGPQTCKVIVMSNTHVGLPADSDRFEINIRKSKGAEIFHTLIRTVSKTTSNL